MACTSAHNSTTTPMWHRLVCDVAHFPAPLTAQRHQCADDRACVNSRSASAKSPPASAALPWVLNSSACNTTQRRNCSHVHRRPSKGQGTPHSRVATRTRELHTSTSACIDSDTFDSPKQQREQATATGQGSSSVVAHHFIVCRCWSSQPWVQSFPEILSKALSALPKNKRKVVGLPCGRKRSRERRLGGEVQWRLIGEGRGDACPCLVLPESCRSCVQGM